MAHRHEQRGVTVAAALYPLGGCWPARPYAEEQVPTWTQAVLGRVRRIRTAVAVRSARRELMELDDRMLKDMGLSRSELLGLDLTPTGSKRNG